VSQSVARCVPEGITLVKFVVVFGHDLHRLK